MNSTCQHLAPSISVDFGNYFAAVLSVSGVLFGLSFTALLFVIQSGFSSFQYSRRMFLELYVHFGSGLLIGLAYLTLISLFAQYAWEYAILVNLVYYLLMLLYLRSMFKHQSHAGYIHTIHSNKFVPRGYGKIRAFFRYITNLGLLPTFVLFSTAVFIICYPVFVSHCSSGSFGISKEGLYISTLIVLGHSLLKVTRFIPEFFHLSNQELDYQRPEKEKGNPNIDYIAEKEAYKKYLEGHDYSEIGIFNEKEFLDGTAWIDILSDDKPEIWTNIHIEVNDVTPEHLSGEVCSYAYELLARFIGSRVDVNSIVLSFHIKIAGDTKNSRNVFFRTDRSELSKIVDDPEEKDKFPHNMKNVLFDELLRAYGDADA